MSPHASRRQHVTRGASATCSVANAAKVRITADTNATSFAVVATNLGIKPRRRKVSLHAPQDNAMPQANLLAVKILDIKPSLAIHLSILIYTFVDDKPRSVAR